MLATLVSSAGNSTMVLILYLSLHLLCSSRNPTSPLPPSLPPSIIYLVIDVCFEQYLCCGSCSWLQLSAEHHWDGAYPYGLSRPCLLLPVYDPQDGYVTVGGHHVKEYQLLVHSPILSSPSPSHSLPLSLSPSTSTYPWNSVDFAHRPRSCDKSQCFSTWRSARTSCGEPTATPFPTKRSDHRGCNNGQHPQVHLVAPEWLQHTCGGQGKLAVWWAKTKDCHRMYFFFLLYFLLWFSIFCFWFSILYFYFFNLWYSGSCTN